MTTVDFITMSFCRIDDALREVPKHPQAHLSSSEVVTLGVLFALKGVGERAFDRWVDRDDRPLFPHLPERSRLFRLLTQQRAWTQHFLAEPGVAVRGRHVWDRTAAPAPRATQQLGSKGTPNRRWTVGAKFAFVLDHLGHFVAWECNWARTPDRNVRPVIAAFDGVTVVLTDSAWHGKTQDLPNRKVCPRSTWNTRMLIETVLSMLTTVCHLKKVAHRAADYFRMRMAFITAPSICSCSGTVVGWMNMASSSSLLQNSACDQRIRTIG